MKQILKNNIKAVALLCTFALFIGFSSCIDDSDTRTYEQEMKELNELILTLQANGVDVDTTALGVYYIVHTAGEGPMAVEGDSVSIE